MSEAQELFHLAGFSPALWNVVATPLVNVAFRFVDRLYMVREI